MSISFDIPADMESSLREQFEDLDAVAREALGVELYRQRKMTQYQLGRLLNLSRFEVDELLQRYGVFYELSAEDVLKEAESLRDARKS